MLPMAVRLHTVYKNALPSDAPEYASYYQNQRMQSGATPVHFYSGLRD